MLISKDTLSGSDDGRNILIAATATLGDTIHTAPSDSKLLDEIWLWAMNTGPDDLKLTLEWGGVTSPDDLIELTIPQEDGPIVIVPGWVLKGNSTPKVVTAFAETTNLLTIGGYVNRISQA